MQRDGRSRITVSPGNKLFLTISGSRGTISIYKKFLEALGKPTHILVQIEVLKGEIYIRAAQEEEPDAIKIGPAVYGSDKSHHSLLRRGEVAWIIQMKHWDEMSTYRIPGFKQKDGWFRFDIKEGTLSPLSGRGIKNTASQPVNATEHMSAPPHNATVAMQSPQEVQLTTGGNMDSDNYPPLPDEEEFFGIQRFVVPQQTPIPSQATEPKEKISLSQQRAEMVAGRVVGDKGDQRVTSTEMPEQKGRVMQSRYLAAAIDKNIANQRFARQMRNWGKDDEEVLETYSTYRMQFIVSETEYKCYLSGSMKAEEFETSEVAALDAGSAVGKKLFIIQRIRAMGEAFDHTALAVIFGVPSKTVKQIKTLSAELLDDVDILQSVDWGEVEP